MDPSRIAPLIYRITGPQSIERLDPLLRLLQPATATNPEVEWQRAQETDERLSFVWETACEKAWRDRHLQSTVLNRLNNSQVRSDQIFLKQELMTCFASTIRYWRTKATWHICS